MFQPTISRGAQAVVAPCLIALSVMSLSVLACLRADQVALTYRALVRRQPGVFVRDEEFRTMYGLVSRHVRDERGSGLASVGSRRAGPA